jgi:hypothetical protein
MQVELRLTASAIRNPETVIPEAQASGLSPTDFSNHKMSLVWRALYEMWNEGIAIDEVTTRDKSDVNTKRILEEAGDQEIDPQTYIKIVLEKSLERILKNSASEMAEIAQEDVQSAISYAARLSEGASERWARMVSPTITNPADMLDASGGWHTTTGLEFIDRIVRLTSGGLHFLAGDPGSGKTSLVIHALAHNARRGVPSIGILAESSQLEISLAMLTQAQKLSAYQANQIRYNPEYRTEENIQRVRHLWDKEFGDLPLQIFSVTDGPQAVINIVNSISKPSFICIDHAFAVVAQNRGADQREYQTFNDLFSGVESAAERNDHVVVMVNQYTKSGRQGEKRGPDAQFGGSGVQNYATTMIHLMKPEADVSTAAGYRKMQATIPKCRAMLAADENGNPIDPVRYTEDIPLEYWIHTTYRRLLSECPIGG